MVVIMIMPVMMNIFHYQQSLSFNAILGALVHLHPNLQVYLQMLVKAKI